MPVCDLTMCSFISVCVSFSTLTSLRPNSTYITVSHRKESFINSQREETFSNLRGKPPILPFLTLCLKKKGNGNKNLSLPQLSLQNTTVSHAAVIIYSGKSKKRFPETTNTKRTDPQSFPFHMLQKHFKRSHRIGSEDKTN